MPKPFIVTPNVKGSTLRLVTFGIDEAEDYTDEEVACVIGDIEAELARL